MLLLPCNTGGLSVQSNLWSSAFWKLRHHADIECVQSTPSLVSVRHVPLARASAVCHLDCEFSLIVLSHTRQNLQLPGLIALHALIGGTSSAVHAVHEQAVVITLVYEQSCAHCLHVSSRLSAVLATCPTQSHAGPKYCG